MPTELGGLERRQPTRPTGAAQPHPPEPDNLPCPRCDSTNTKFCYYNNYNLSQPRYFCKACRRYWTRGGTLRNVPVGGGSRKNSKRSRATNSSASSSSSSSSSYANPVLPPHHHPGVMAPTMTSDAGVIIKHELPVPVTCDLNLNDGSFTSLLTANPVGLHSGGSLFGYGFEEMGMGFGYGYGPTSGETHVSETTDAGAHAWHLGGFDGSAAAAGGGNNNGGASEAVNYMHGGDYFHVA